MSENMSSLYPIKAEIAIERVSRIVMEWEEELNELLKTFEIYQKEFDKNHGFIDFGLLDLVSLIDMDSPMGMVDIKSGV